MELLKYGKTSIPLYEIAEIIKKDWKNLSPYAKPYLDAMSGLDRITDKYYTDNGNSIVAYFLDNADGWRGEIAKEVKKHLKDLLKNKII